MIYWRILNIDGFLIWRFNWLCIQALSPLVDYIMTPSPIYRYVTREAKKGG